MSKFEGKLTDKIPSNSKINFTEFFQNFGKDSKPNEDLVRLLLEKHKLEVVRAFLEKNACSEDIVLIDACEKRLIILNKQIKDLLKN